MDDKRAHDCDSESDEECAVADGVFRRENDREERHADPDRDQEKPYRRENVLARR